jgi:hypothetical protein
MSRLLPLALVFGLAGLSSADDPAPAPPPAKLPAFKGYMTLPDTVTTKLKAVDGDTLTITLTERDAARGRPLGRKGRPTPQTRPAEHTLTLHPDALVRWSKKPDRKDDKGKSKPYTPAEMKILQSPAGAPGILGDKLELLAGHTVELTLMVPAKKPAEELTEDDYRVKFVVIQGSPTDPKPTPPKRERDKDKK